MEQNLWTGRPSVVLKFHFLILATAIYLMIYFLPTNCLHFRLYGYVRVDHMMIGFCLLTLGMFLFHSIALLCSKYELTSERLFIYSGLFNRVRREIELYRIRDYSVISPIYLRIFGLSNVVITSTDRDSPGIVLMAVGNGYKVADTIRMQVELQRQAKGFIEVSQNLFKS